LKFTKSSETKLRTVKSQTFFLIYGLATNCKQTIHSTWKYDFEACALLIVVSRTAKQGRAEEKKTSKLEF